MDIIVCIGIGLLSRLVPHPPNMTTVSAMALFSASKLGLKKSLIILMSTMMITDVILGFHSVMWATYGCLLATVFMGRLIQNRLQWPMIVGTAFTSSLVFFVVTNFAVWIAPSSMYPHTIEGLIRCYVMAIPFWRNALVGDLGYSLLFFGGYAWAMGFTQRLALKKS